MSLLNGALIGAQTPRVRLVPRAKDNDFEDAAFLAASYGLTPDEWQENVLEGWLGIRHDGKWAAPRCGLAVPRQNGKNGALEIRELYGMIVKGERFLHTAHEVKTARKAFLRLLSFFENARKYPELAALVAPNGIRKTNGQEAIVLANGGSVEFVARSKGSARGFSVDVIVMDEAQELGDEAFEALGYTTSASPNYQHILTGTPPGPTANGEVFTRMREEGIDGKNRRLCWMEWGCDGDGVDLDDRANWAKANPALGIRLSLEFTADERGAFSDEGFARERLGMWDGEASLSVIRAKAWADLANPESQAADPVAFAIDMDPNRLMASIGVAGIAGDRIHVEAIENRSCERGSGWIVERVKALQTQWKPCAIVLDAASPAASLIPDLEAARVKLTITNARDMAQACGLFYDAATDGSLVHIDSPLLNRAVAGARKRNIGAEGGWGWNRKDNATDITPLVAVTLATYGLSTKRKRNRQAPKRIR